MAKTRDVSSSALIDKGKIDLDTDFGEDSLNDVLEVTMDESDDLSSTESVQMASAINYSLLEQQHLEEISQYKSKTHLPEEMDIYDLESKKQKEQHRLSKSDTMDDAEAKETIATKIYDQVTGSGDEDFESKRRFKNWLLDRSNHTLLFLYAALNPIRTSEVNYE